MSGGGGGAASASGSCTRHPTAHTRATLTHTHTLSLSPLPLPRARKSLDLSSLILEVIKQLSLRFEPSNSDIKKRIEDLIERDYLERDGSDAKILCYCA